MCIGRKSYSQPAPRSPLLLPRSDTLHFEAAKGCLSLGEPDLEPLWPLLADT
jgi:hypothetical protein